MIDIANYIRQKLKEYDPQIDTRIGSVLNDFLISPLTTILEPYQLEHAKILDQLTLSDISELSDDQLNAVAATFLLERKPGAYAVGEVEFFYNSPKSVIIPKGTGLESDGVAFSTTDDYAITKSQMESDLSDYPYYSTGPVQVVADEPGVVGNISPNSNFTVTGTLSTKPSKVINKSAFVSGVDEETNEALFNRIKSAIHGKSLAAPVSIQEKIMDTYTDVVDVEVVGAGHILMIRDLTNAIEDVENYKSLDFEYTYSGVHNGEYDSKHMALTGNFLDLDETADVQFPAITGWIHEFSDDMYHGLYRLYDMQYSEQNSYTLIREYWGDTFTAAFGIQPDLQMILASGMWQIHDGLHPDNTIFYLNEFGIVNNKLRMGKTLSPDATGSSVAIPLAQISGIYEMLISENEIQIENAQLQIFNYISPSSFNNLSPIIHKPIDQHLGIEILCDMSTTDNTEDGEMAYITVLRNSEIFLPHDGFGIAWRKQPEFLLRMDRNWANPQIDPINTGGQGTTQTDANIYYNEQADSGYKAADLLKFREIYGYTPTITGPGYVKARPDLWRYNVYLVDNDILQENVWVGHDQLWDQTSGKNQFLQAAKVWIEPEATYQFKIKIYPKMGVQAWIYDMDDPPGDPYSEANMVINRGQTYPPYVTQSGDKIQTDTGIDILESSRNHFGIAVAETRNCEWYVDNLEVNSFVETFPMQLFRIQYDPIYFDPTEAAQVNYYGVGYDPEQFLLAGETGHSKVKVAVYNVNDDEWDLAQTHTATINDTRDQQQISLDLNPLSDYIDSTGYVNVAATAANSGPTFEDDVNHTLRTYYIEMNNVLANAVHRGNAVDIYVHDPDNIKRGSVSTIMPGSTVTLKTITGINSFVVEIIEAREGISKVVFDQSSYSVNNLSDSKAYSTDANQVISFDLDNMENTLVEFIYYYWVNGPLVDALINDPDERYPAADIMVKAMPPTIITISRLEYSGGLGEDEMKVKIAEYFNYLTETTFDVSDLINVMYDNGATYVNLDMDMTIREYDTTYNMTETTFTASTYTIAEDNISRFYTNPDELYGVTQV
jgi:hypothetical protein